MRTLSLLLSVVFVSGVISAQEKKPSETTLKGEVVDLKCYSSGMGGGSGEEHRDCAIQCIKGGLPVGLLDQKGNLYLLVPKKGMKGGNEALVDHAAETITVKGFVQEKGGMKVIHYTSFEPAK